MTLGQVHSLTVWPVKSMSGGTAVDAVWADVHGLAGDRARALVDQRPMRAGHVLSARNVPGILRWSAVYASAPQRDAVQGPVVTSPDGKQWEWSDPGLAGALSDDLGVPVGLVQGERYWDLADSVLVTTTQTHDAVEQLFGRPLEVARWRTNLHLELAGQPFAEHGWEGRRLLVGDVVLRLLHPCRRCTIPSWSPGGLSRDADLLAWFHREHAGRFGINARVEVPGVLHAGDDVRLD